MKKLEAEKVKEILSPFDNLDDILELEIPRLELGYRTLAVGTFDHWLSHEEYDEKLDMFDNQDIKDLENRAKLLSSFPEIYLYDTDKYDYSDILYKIEKEKLYNYILSSLKKGYLLWFITVNPYMVINITSGLTDMYYIPNSSDFEPLKQKVKDNDLKCFESYY
ncbi:hypothetical protein E0494_10690 [Marinilabiliaceae bacterium JC040]|nr:hypothetical protein [Marinilabiliaceae bacterium JC040]